MASSKALRMNEDLVVANGMENYPHLERYDEALKQLIQQAFAGEVVFAPDGYAYKLALNQTDNKVEYPFISIYPSTEYTLADNNGFGQYQLGMTINDTVDVRDVHTNKFMGKASYLSKNVQHLYIDIDYQVDIWALSRSEGLQVVQELLFWLWNQQEVKIKYYGQEFILSLVPPESFTDNSDLPQVETSGKIYRFTLNLLVHAAIYRSKNYFNVLEKVIELDASEDDKKGGQNVT